MISIVKIKTTPTIVIIVTAPNTKVTATKPSLLSLAAGYINNGINGSQGPKRKIVKRIHGVTVWFFFS